jgi:isocitrate dehydrogenase (NAD+)
VGRSPASCAYSAALVWNDAEFEYSNRESPFFLGYLRVVTIMPQAPTLETAAIPATLIPGDGIGPEIVDAVLAALDALHAPFAWDRQLAGLEGVRAAGDPLPAATLASIRRTRLALKGPLETPSGGGYRSSNVRLREEFQLYANLRPALTIVPGGRFDNIDLVVVRENLEGLYIGHEHYIKIDDDPHAVAMATGVNTRQGSRRLLEFAFAHAVATGRKKVSIVHKANIMKALTGIFLETGLELYERKYKGKFELDTVIIDACAMKLVLNPWQFDVLVTTNLFGDILSDLVAGLVGGLGMTPGGNIGADAAIFEAVHGSAPDIAGKGIANPTALLLAAAMMLDHCRLQEKAARLRASISATLNVDRVKTGDLGGKSTTAEFTRALVSRIKNG